MGGEVGREDLVALADEAQPGEGVDRDGEEQVEELQGGVQPVGVGVVAEDLAPKEIADDQEGEVLGVVHALVLEGQVVPARQVVSGINDRVEHEGHRRMAEELGDRRAQHLGHHDMGRAAGGTPGQLQRRGDGEERGGHHDEEQVLDHVVPEQLAVVDADEAEDGDPGRGECPEPGHGLADRPAMTGVQRVVALDAPEVEARATRIMATGTKSNWVESELASRQRRQRCVVEGREHGPGGYYAW